MKRVLVFGEVLFDRFPDGTEVLGGAPFNVAWNLRGLGADPLLLTRVGEDAAGERILQAMDDFGLDRGLVQRDRERGTGLVDVRIVDGEPSFEILEDRAFDRIAAEDLPAEVGILYHGTLALRAPRSAASLRALRRAHPGTVFVDLNLRPPHDDRSTVEEALAGADTLKLNRDELGSLAARGASVADQARELLDRTRARRICVTEGAEGATLCTADGQKVVSRPAEEATVVDTVGCGDAFSSVLILGLLQNWPLQAALDRATSFAAAVAGLRGATTTDPGFYSSFRSSWSSA